MRGHFINADDIVGIKVNCVGRLNTISSPEVVAEAVRNVMALGVAAKDICVYERFQNQMDEVGYPRFPRRRSVLCSERDRGTNLNYDPAMYDSWLGTQRARLLANRLGALIRAIFSFP
jgi:hypothetical protein